MGKEYLYEIGETVNNSLIIVSQTRQGKKNNKAYEVQSLTYPDAPTYEALEYNLLDGKGDAYVAGRKIFEGNSLYSKIKNKSYLIDVDEAKTLAPYSNKQTLFKCPDCDKRKRMKPNTLLTQGFSCPMCSKGVPYPELFFMSYNEQLNLGFIPQQRFDDFDGYIFDFVDYEHRVIVETHGRAHYEECTGHMNHKRTTTSDKAKRKYCKDNNWILIELDCRISSFEFIKGSIANELLLEDIADRDVEGMLDIIETNKRYPTKEIVSLYKDGENASQIAKIYKVNYQTIINILRKNGIEIRKGSPKGNVPPNARKIKCLNTDDIFISAAEAIREYNLPKGVKIAMVCKGKRKSAGKHPQTGEQLQWEYVEE